MGNCLRLLRRCDASSMVQADDDWHLPLASKDYVSENESILDDHNRVFSSSTSSTSSSSNGREIKIKITKKQLEKLLGEVDMHDMPVDLVLSKLINASDQHSQIQHQGSWKPRLQSIPEVN